MQLPQGRGHVSGIALKPTRVLRESTLASLVLASVQSLAACPLVLFRSDERAAQQVAALAQRVQACRRPRSALIAGQHGTEGEPVKRGAGVGDLCLRRSQLLTDQRGVGILRASREA